MRVQTVRLPALRPRETWKHFEDSTRYRLDGWTTSDLRPAVQPETRACAVDVYKLCRSVKSFSEVEEQILLSTECPGYNRIKHDELLIRHGYTLTLRQVELLSERGGDGGGVSREQGNLFIVRHFAGSSIYSDATVLLFLRWIQEYGKWVFHPVSPWGNFERGYRVFVRRPYFLK
jgi:hypothetical protein